MGTHGAVDPAALTKSVESRGQVIFQQVLSRLQLRLDTEGVEADDPMLQKVSQLVYTKRQVSFESDPLQKNALAASRLQEARRTYAEVHELKTGAVTKKMLEDSPEGLKYWLHY